MGRSILWGSRSRIILFGFAEKNEHFVGFPYFVWVICEGGVFCSRIHLVFGIAKMSEGREDRSGFSLLSFFEYNGAMESLTVTRETTLAGIISCLWEKGISLVGGKMLQYSHPAEHFPVSIRSDGDIAHMLKVHELVKKYICKMGMSSDEPPSKRRRCVHGEEGSSRQSVHGEEGSSR